MSPKEREEEERSGELDTCEPHLPLPVASDGLVVSGQSHVSRGSRGSLSGEKFCAMIQTLAQRSPPWSAKSPRVGVQQLCFFH